MARILGLDIGEHSVRGVLVRTTLRKVEVVRYVEMAIEAEPAPPPPVEGEAPDAVIMPPTPLRKSIVGILGGLGQSADRVVTAVDGRGASLRVVELPLGAKKRVAEILPFELESVLPFEPDETVVDHQVVGERDGQLRVLACAAPKTHISEHLTAVQTAGVDPREVAAGAAALDGLVPLLPILERVGPVLLVEAGDDTTDICFLDLGKPQLARTLSAGLSNTDALVTALKRTLTTWRAGGGANPVEAFLLGSATNDPNSLAWFSHVLETEVRTLPLPPAEGADEDLGRYGRAAALACRTALKGKRIDLRQGELAFTQTTGAMRQYSRLGAACAAIVLLAFLFATWAKYMTLDDERDTLQDELAEVTADAFGRATRSPSRAERLLRRGTGDEDPLPRFDAYDTLDAISASLPEEITHSTRRLTIELEEDGHSGSIEVRGVVASVAERDSIAEAIEGHECITDMEKGSTSAGPGGNGLSYQLRATMRCPGAPEPEDRRSRRRRRGR